MNREGSVLIAAAIFLSWFVFRMNGEGSVLIAAAIFLSWFVFRMKRKRFVLIAAAIFLSWFVFGMNGEGSVLIAAAAIFLSWFVFRKFVNNNTGIPPQTSSASESAPSSGRPFEVFLSFRGTDTRYGFTDYLYHDLVAAGVQTFRDDEELRVGDELGPELIRAIEESKIAIPVFSKRYAESKWCLRELAKIAECRQKERQLIFPIFYDVKPSDVNDYENGCYKDFFIAHDNEREVQNWKNAFAMFKGYKKLVGLELMKETKG